MHRQSAKKAQGVVVVAAHEMLGVLGNPAQALSRVRAVIDDVAAECHGVPRAFSLENGLQRGPVAMDIGED